MSNGQREARVVDAEVFADRGEELCAYHAIDSLLFQRRAQRAAAHT